MNIFTAGVHGVGKTFLATRLPPSYGLTHTSASKLIKDEKMLPNWGNDKLVADIDSNQIALTTAVKRHNDARIRLLLDGHFVLLDANGNFTRIETEVFRSLNLDAVILIEEMPNIVVERIRQRDDRVMDLKLLVDFITAERTHAQFVCNEIGLPLNILMSPSPEVFAQAISKFLPESRPL